MSTVVEEASNHAQLKALGAITASAWVALVAIVVGLSPDPVLHRVAFFVVFMLALAGTFSLGAYALSFQLFASRRFRGNLRRAIEHGTTTAIVVTAAALLQLGRALSYFNAALLAVLFVIVQIAVLLRR